MYIFLRQFSLFLIFITIDLVSFFVILYWLKSNNEDQFLFLIINILSLGKMIYAKICAEIMPSGRTIFFQVKGRVKSPAATNSHWHLIKLAHSLCSARPFDTIYGTWSRKITMFCQMFLKAKHCWAELSECCALNLQNDLVKTTIFEWVLALVQCINTVR